MQTPLNLLIALADHKPWAQLLVGRLSDWPVDVHWSHTGEEAIRQLADRRMHLGVVDLAVPMGGLELVRRVRLLGLRFPCLLVADEPDARLLQAALALDVCSVIAEQATDQSLFPAVVRLLRRFEGFFPPTPENVN